MYADYFGLRVDPFKVTPDLQFYFRGERQNSAERALLSALAQPDGLVLVAASAGCGKTMLLRHVAEHTKSTTPVAMVWNPALTFEDLLAAICAQFGLDETADDATHRLRSIEFLSQHVLSEGRAPVVMIDDADNLPYSTLQHLTELCRLKIGKKQAVALVLSSALGRSDRVDEALPVTTHVQHLTLEPLTPPEVAAYVTHRLRTAGCEGPLPFTKGALTRLTEISRGVPRLVNMLAGKALFLAYLGDEQQVDEALVAEVASELWSTIESGLATGSTGTALAERMDSHPVISGRAPPVPASVFANTDPPSAKAPGSSAEEVLIDLSRLARADRDDEGSQGDVAASVMGARRPLMKPVYLALIGVVGLGAFLSTEFGQNWSREWAQPILQGIGHSMRDRLRNHDQPDRSDQAVDATSPDSAARLVLPPSNDAATALSASPSSQGAGRSAIGVESVSDPAVVRPNSDPVIGKPAGEDWVSALEPSGAQVRRLLEQAVRYQNAGQFTDPNGANALQTYRRVLELDPGNAQAEQGIQAMLSRLVRWGRVAESRGDFEAAAQFYSTAVGIDPESAELHSALKRTQR